MLELLNKGNNMTKDDLKNALLLDLKPLIERNIGLTIFARNRSKFEGWLKVELVRALAKYNARPEVEYIDVSGSYKNITWGIELKTINTNYIYPEENVENIIRPITRNIEGVIEDIKKLNLKTLDNKYIIFIAFPFSRDSIESEQWTSHIKKIEGYVSLEDRIEFLFNKSEIIGAIYWGKI